MAHYAILDDNNVVLNVIVGKDENIEGIDWEQYYSSILNRPVKRTSYNTAEGVHLTGGIPFRKNYAGVGFSYDPDRDAFIPEKPFVSWILNENKCTWEAPIPYPQDGKRYRWDEDSTSWLEVI